MLMEYRRGRGHLQEEQEEMLTEANAVRRPQAPAVRRSEKGAGKATACAAPIELDGRATGIRAALYSNGIAEQHGVAAAWAPPGTDPRVAEEPEDLT
jgi:hypothetical protein